MNVDDVHIASDYECYTNRTWLNQVEQIAGAKHAMVKHATMLCVAAVSGEVVKYGAFRVVALGMANNISG